MSSSDYITKLGAQAKASAQILRQASSKQKNKFLLNCIDAIYAEKTNIFNANAKDIEHAEDKKLDASLIDRLTINEKRISQIVAGLQQIASLPDPVGEVVEIKNTIRGLKVGRMRVPLGVIAMIYESRPNVTIDAASLCLKSGNAVILRGGSEALNSNLALYECIQIALRQSELPEYSVQLVTDPDRAIVSEMLKANQWIDVLIPRGGKGLVKLVADEAKMPVIKHLDGICHIYVEKNADLKKAVDICENGKTYRFGICGSTETILVDEEIADAFLPELAARLSDKKVEIRGCEKTCKILSNAVVATEEDWSTEYLAAIVSIKIVKNIDEAIAHIEKYSSKHTDSIVTSKISSSDKFINSVDSASVMVNTPTCFADGFEYGLGAEIGISTDKMHWRGPVGLEALTCCKFVISSDGVLRD